MPRMPQCPRGEGRGARGSRRFPPTLSSSHRARKCGKQTSSQTGGSARAARSAGVLVRRHPEGPFVGGGGGGTTSPRSSPPDVLDDPSQSPHTLLTIPVPHGLLDRRSHPHDLTSSYLRLEHQLHVVVSHVVVSFGDRFLDPLVVVIYLLHSGTLPVRTHSSYALTFAAFSALRFFM